MMDKKKDIIKTTIKIISIYGIQKTSFTLIASASKLKSHTIFQIFPTKEILVLAVLETLWKDYQKKLYSAYETEDLIEVKLKKAIQIRHRFLKRYFMFNLWDYNSYMPFGVGQIQDYLTIIKNQEIDFFHNIFKDLRFKKEITNPDSRHYAVFFLDLMIGLTLNKLGSNSFPKISKSELEEILSHQLNLIQIYIQGIKPIRSAIAV
jgi:AcrR family transcriptional regulator